MTDKPRTIKIITQINNRLDKEISNQLPEYSRSFIGSLIKNKQVSINNKIINKNSYKIKQNEKITINIPKTEILKVEPKKGDLDIIFENTDFLLINKPPFLPVHTSHGHQNDTLINILLHHYPKFANFKPINNIFRPGIVHRLDKDTSGLILIAKNQNSLNFFQNEIKNRHWIKKYYALVINNNRKSRGVITKNICRDPHHRQKFTTTHLSKGKTATTEYKIIKNFNYKNNNLSLVDVNLKTGRTHQIRVHLLSENMPIIGDQTYYTKESKQISQLLNINRQLLHAYYLKILNPHDKKKLTFKMNLPKDFDIILSHLKKQV